jgi:hypothetical protein
MVLPSSDSLPMKASLLFCLKYDCACVTCCSCVIYRCTEAVPYIAGRQWSPHCAEYLAQSCQ